MTPSPPYRGSRLSRLAIRVPDAPARLRAWGLDYCCKGSQTLEDACEEQGLNLETVIADLESANPKSSQFPRRRPLSHWLEAPIDELTEFIRRRYHSDHRTELPRLTALARKVERVHASRPDCPVGLADHLEKMREELEDHMRKEELVLFPLIERGDLTTTAQPISVMEREHRDHGKRLARMRQLGGSAPPTACASWIRLIDGLTRLEADLMEHILLENHVLFPRALQTERMPS